MDPHKQKLEAPNLKTANSGGGIFMVVLLQILMVMTS